MRLHPGMIGEHWNAISRAISTSELLRDTKHGIEISEAAQLGGDGRVASCSFPIAQGLPTSLRRRLHVVVSSLPIGTTDRVDGRKIDYVEASLSNGGNEGSCVAKGSVTARLTCRARKEFIPRRIPGSPTIGANWKFIALRRIKEIWIPLCNLDELARHRSLREQGLRFRQLLKRASVGL